MKCYDCRYLDRSIVLATYPPKYICTYEGKAHFADDTCKYEHVPVVRCKDCKHSISDGYHEKAVGCTYWIIGDDIPQGKNEFCSYGERKEE